MGKTETFHGRWSDHCGALLAGAWVDKRDSRTFRYGAKHSKCARLETWSKARVLADDFQSKHATIALAVLSIYAVDFAINAGRDYVEKFSILWLMKSCSTIILPKSHCRHAANTKATARFGLG